MEVEKIIVKKKRAGFTEAFDPKKIHAAIRKSADRVLFDMTDKDCKKVSDAVVSRIEEPEVTVRKLHKLVEVSLDECGFNKVAESYRQYRNYKIDAQKIMEAVDAKTLELSYKADKSNANCDSSLVSTKRSLIYGEQQKERYRRVFLNEMEREALSDGYIYAHDQSARLDTTNCFRRDTKFITSVGVKSFYDFSDGDEITVLTPYGNWKKAVVRSYGWQRLNEVVIGRGGRLKRTIYCTGNHRWILEDNTTTTNLKVGDYLLKMPDITEFDWNDLSLREKKLWCWGFALGDGSSHKDGYNDVTTIRLCGHKIEDFSQRFIDCGYSVTESGVKEKVTMVYIRDFGHCKEIPWLYFTKPEDIQYYINGLMCADGAKIPDTTLKFNGIQVTGEEINKHLYDLLNIAGYFVTSTKDLTGQVTNYGVRKKETKEYRVSSSYNRNWRVRSITPSYLNNKAQVWCLEVEDDHSFVLEGGIPTGNCSLFNLGKILKDGFMLSNTEYNEPQSLQAAISVTADVLSVIAGNQYGGLTAPEIDTVLAPYAQKSYDFYLNQYKELMEDAGCTVDPEKQEKYAVGRVIREAETGFQQIEMSSGSVASCRGDFPSNKIE